MRTPSSRPRPRRFGAIVVLLALTAAILVGLSGLAGASTSATTHRGAKLTLKRTDPATVRGTGFRAHKAVSVKLVAARTLVRHPVTNGQGTFTATFPTAVDRCAAWSVTASQPGRATVVLRDRPLPECAPARTP
jgi:hypothetical protein